MIELPASPAPNAMEPALLDYGQIQRGASSLRVDRPGNRFRIAFGFPPMPPEKGEVFTSRIADAKSKGIRVPLPLLVPQGAPGAPKVDGDGQAGTTLVVRDLTPGYVAKEGYWLTVVEADGTGYLHRLTATVRADAAGDAALSIKPPLRAPFASGDRVELAAPWIEGFIDGEEWGWSVGVDRLIAPGFTVEEFG